MAHAGFEEAQASYHTDQVLPVVGQFRRFGDAGPAYEIVKLTGEAAAAIRVVYSGEELEYRLDRLRADPIAVTIP